MKKTEKIAELKVFNNTVNFPFSQTTNTFAYHPWPIIPVLLSKYKLCFLPFIFFARLLFLLWFSWIFCWQFPWKCLHNIILLFYLIEIFRYGRVNYVLARRIELLEEVKRLQKSLGVPGDASYTCETAGYFFLYQV